MWIPKSKNEIDIIERKRKVDAIKASVLIPIITITIIVLFLKFIKLDNVGLRHGSKDPLSWLQILNTYPLLLFTGFISGLLGYSAVRSSKSTTLVCNKCGKVIAYQKEKSCTCGGAYVSIEDMKWLDENADRHKKKNDNEIKNNKTPTA